MRTGIPVIIQKELILFKCIPRQQAWDDVLGIFWGGGERGESRNLREKDETFEKLGEKDKTLTPRKSHLQTTWFGGTYDIVLNNVFA